MDTQVDTRLGRPVGATLRKRRFGPVLTLAQKTFPAVASAGAPKTVVLIGRNLSREEARREACRAGEPVGGDLLSRASGRPQDVLPLGLQQVELPIHSIAGPFRENSEGRQGGGKGQQAFVGPAGLARLAVRLALAQALFELYTSLVDGRCS
jgi:hypothetical protein